MERLIGNLWLVRGDLAELYEPTGSPLVIVPGYTNRAVHPVAEALIERFPVLRRRMYRRHDQPYIRPGAGRIERCCDTTFLVTASMFYTPHSSIHRLPECPAERDWWQIAKAAIRENVTSIHWQEIENPDMVDVVGALFRLFFDHIITRQRLQFVYYNPDWPCRETETIHEVH